jgi:hypothetical protein
MDQRAGRRPHRRTNVVQASTAQRTYHRMQLLRAIRSLELLLVVLQRITPRSIEESSARLRCRSALDRAMPYLNDEEGRYSL